MSKGNKIRHGRCLLAVLLMLSTLFLAGCRSQSSADQSSDILPPTVSSVQAEPEYELWLASAAMLGLSLEYPDFELDGIYALSATSLAEKAESKGVYLRFRSGGADCAIHCVPLEGERSEEGSVDLSSKAAGFATFDLMEPAGFSLEGAIEFRPEQLKDTIARSELVSLYYH